jgi:Predicted Rossmann fold nucleotide-binding protein involved in DNA uptake
VKLTDNDMVTLLLTTSLGLNDKSIKQLSLTEWNKLVRSIVSSSIKEPKALLELDEGQIRNILSLREEDAKRIHQLLTRGAFIAIELEDLNKRGIYTLCRGDKLYPKLIKQKLKENAPSVIFYCGNLDLLNNTSIGMVGSRNIDEKILKNTILISEKAVSEGLTIVSGGAKGVDTSSETAAFNAGGSYISFICDSLVARIKRKEIRDRLETGRCLYLTVDSPSFPFTGWRAMARNKYIYSLAKATFILNSDYQKGGTWEGAVENLKKKLSLPYVISNGNKGNIALIDKGCKEIDTNKEFIIKDLCKNKSNNNDGTEFVEQINLFLDE